MANYISKDRDQTILLSVSLRDQLQEGTFEYALDYLIEHQIDVSIFEQGYKNDEVGRPAWDPKILLKITGR